MIPFLHGSLRQCRAWIACVWIGSMSLAAENRMFRDNVAVSEVRNGIRKEANAAWFGFDPADATEAIQSAIRSPARKIVIPNLGKPWIVRPIELRNDLELLLEPGVVIEAKAGEFMGGNDCLFRAQNCTNITIGGTGAILRMRKSDYQKPPYPKAEWRMGIGLYGCHRVRLEGLRVESSGGDGIYIGSSRENRWSMDIVVRNCVCTDNHRQGLSVISAVNLLIEDSEFSGTSGTPPAAGIDLEPDEPDERLVNCLIKRCRMIDNDGNGMLVYLKPMTQTSEPVDIRFENCHVSMTQTKALMPRTGGSGIAVGWVRDEGPRGRVEFVGCTSSNTGREAVRVAEKSSEGVLVRFVGGRWTNSWTAPHRTYAGYRSPILIENRDSAFCKVPGGVEWEDCVVHDTMEGPTVRFDDEGTGLTLKNLSGTIQVNNPWGATGGFGVHPIGVGLRFQPVATRVYK